MYTITIYFHSVLNLEPVVLHSQVEEIAFMYGEFYSTLASCKGVTVRKDGESPIFFK